MNSQARDRPKRTEGPPDQEITALTPGDVVADRDDPDPDPAIVINTPDETADEWGAYADVTVADDNPEYPDDAAVVCVVFKQDLLDARPEYDGRELPLADVDGCKYYSFPRPRLEKVGEWADASPAPELDEDLAAVEDRLQDSAAVDRKVDGGEVVLVVDKLGEEYRVHPNGAVEGDGALRDRLEDVVAEVMG